MTTDLAWLKPGAPAVILQDSTRGSLRAEAVTVERVLKRDVVLSNGERFKQPHLKNYSGGTWGTPTDLVPANDPRVPKVREAIRRSYARTRAHMAYEGWRIGQRPAVEVAEAFRALAEMDEPA